MDSDSDFRCRGPDCISVSGISRPYGGGRIGVAMAAIMREQLEPEGLGHDLLTGWAPWVRDGSSNDWPTMWNVKQRIDRAYQGDMPRDVQIVDKIVARQRLKYHSYWSIASRYYLDSLPIWAIARGMGREWPEARVRTCLLAFCGLVEREYRDWE